MARIAGVDIPNDKRVVVSLTYVYGIGLPTSKKILAAAGVSEDIRVKDLTIEQEDAIRREVDAIKVEGNLSFVKTATRRAAGDMPQGMSSASMWRLSVPKQNPNSGPSIPGPTLRIKESLTLVRKKDLICS